MVRNQDRRGPGIVEWSLPDDEVGQVLSTVDVHDEDLDPDDAQTTWCPECGTDSAMRAAVTPDGRRFDLCDGCGLLWHVDRSLGRAEAHAISLRRPPAHEATPARDSADVRLAPPADRDEPDPQPARDEADVSHPMAS